MRYLIAILSIFLAQNIAFGSPTYNCYYFNQLDFVATTVSTVALAKNSERRCLLFQNKNPAAASQGLIKFNDRHTGTEGLSLAGASTILEIINVPGGSVFLRSINSGNITTILEGK